MQSTTFNPKHRRLQARLTAAGGAAFLAGLRRAISRHQAIIAASIEGPAAAPACAPAPLAQRIRDVAGIALMYFAIFATGFWVLSLLEGLAMALRAAMSAPPPPGWF